MRLFHILTRYVATGKRKITRKLLNRVRREVSGKRPSQPSKSHSKKHPGSARLWCATVAAVLSLMVCLINGHAATAAQPHESDAEPGGYSAAGLFNKANACAREGKPGLAVLNYERARLLAPGDADIAANLHFLRVRAGLPETTANWFARGLTYGRPNILAWLGSCGLVLAGMSILLAPLLPRWRPAFRALTLGGALFVASALGSMVETWPKMKEAVVITRDAPVRQAPVSSAETAFKLREGETVTLLAEHHDFDLIQTSAGRSGWMAGVDLARVAGPSAARSHSLHRT